MPAAKEAGSLDRKTGLYKFYRGLDRSYFIDNEYKHLACYDNALPIGYDQTISQPSLVYMMTCELDTDESCKVLEIGTGSGYQTVLLAEFSDAVYTMEKIPALSAGAKRRIDGLGYGNVFFKVGDGSEGWEEYSPYDRIMVTAAASYVPEPLLHQLKSPGRMVIPVGESGYQELLLIVKDENGKVAKHSLSDVLFVELKGKYGWDRRVGGNR